MIAKFFPQSQYPIEICAHRRNRDFTFTDCTDTLVPSSRYAVEYFLFKNNIRAGAYIGRHVQEDSWDITDCEKTGAIRCDVYYNRNGVPGTTEEERMTEVTNWFRKLTGRYPSALSFGLGVNYSPWSIDFFLSGRNSSVGSTSFGVNDEVFLGWPQLSYTRSNYSNKPSTIRWSDGLGAGSSGQGSWGNLSWSQVEATVQTTAENRGWMQNFTHWHDLRGGKSPIPANVLYMQDQFYQTVKNKVASLGASMHTCSPGEAIEYMVFRSLIKKVSCYTFALEPTAIGIAIEVDGLFLQQAINTPISVSVDLNGSHLSGKNIKASNNCNILRLGDNKYIIEVPFRIDDANNKIIMVKLTEGIGSYYSEALPVITISKSLSAATIETDVETKAVLFRKTKGAPDDSFTKVGGRYSDLSKARTITGIDFNAYDYVIGVINRFEIMAVGYF